MVFVPVCLPERWSFCKRRQVNEMEIIPYCVYVCMGICVRMWTLTSTPIIMVMYLCLSLCLYVLYKCCLCAAITVIQHCMMPSNCVQNRH